MGQLVSLVADELRGRVVRIYTLNFVVDNIPPKAHCLQVKDLIYLTQILTSAPFHLNSRSAARFYMVL